MEHRKLTGTGVAIVTPFNNDLHIDYRSLGNLIEHLILNHVDYLVVLGTTGESVTLNKTEKNELVKFIKATVNKRLPLVLGIGGCSTNEIIETIQHTDFDGIEAILSVSPYYNKPTQKGIYEHYKAIAQQSPVPVILYNVPGRTGSNISAETTIMLANDFKNIIATKEASGNLTQIMEIIKNKPGHFFVISGDDAVTLPIIALGGKGLISVAANAFPKEVSTLVNSSLNGDYETARELQYQLLDIFNLLFADGSPGGIKAALDIAGIVKNNLRLPLVPVNEDIYNKIKIAANKLSKN